MKLTFSKAVKKISTTLFVLTILFNSISCKMQEDPDPEIFIKDLSKLEKNNSLIGTWQSQFGEVYKISSSSFENYFTDYTTQELQLYYSADNLYTYKETETSGYIYFQFNDENHIGTKSFNESTYESVPAEKGQWYAIHYKNLSENNIYIFTAAKTDGTDYCFNTLEETAKTLTVENGYFSYYSECVKNEIN